MEETIVDEVTIISDTEFESLLKEADDSTTEVTDTEVIDGIEENDD